MKSATTHGAKFAVAGLVALTATGFLAPASASADVLSAASGVGTFTINFDREAFAPLFGGSSASPGIFHAGFFNTAASDYSSVSGNAMMSAVYPYVEQSSTSLVHDITATGPNPSGQAGQRYVRGTTSDFAVHTLGNTVTGGAGELGMTGVQVIGMGPSAGVYAGMGMAYGDYSLTYDPTAQAEQAGSTEGLTGWYLQNHIYGPGFFMDAYDLANLNVVVIDANNWKMTGDLLMSASNSGMLMAAEGTDMGNFCLGVGSYSGCAAPAAVPVPGAVWMFGSGLIGLMGFRSRKPRVAA